MSSAILQGVVAEWLLAQYRGLFREQELVVTGINAMTPVVPGDPERVSFTAVNVGPGTCFLSSRVDLGAGNGIRLLSNGGFLHVDLAFDTILPMLPWFAQGSGVQTTLYVLTVKRDHKFKEGE